MVYTSEGREAMTRSGDSGKSTAMVQAERKR